MRIKANDIEITIKKTKGTYGDPGLNILISSKNGKDDSLCHILPDVKDSKIVIFNSATARKHGVGFDVIDTSW